MVQEKNACGGLKKCIFCVCALYLCNSAKFPHGARENTREWTEKMSVCAD